MPTYEYSCLDCGNRFDIFATLSEKEKGLKVKCPKCKSKKTSQVFGNISVITPGKNKSPSSNCPPGCSCT
ncbi:zinc ribbon domain-containing protein [bacterium]|nr:zinc ribbon domain-containing protein [bacterium]